MMTKYFFEEPMPNMELITGNKQLAKLSSDEVKQLLAAAKTALEGGEWTAEAIQNTLNNLLEQTGQKPGILFSIVRIATTWAPFSPQLNDTLELLGKDRTLQRLDQAINL
jgi:glutamyl-tRNA synthetase